MSDEPRKIIETKLDLTPPAPKLDAAEATEKIRAARGQTPRSRPREESVDLSGVHAAVADKKAGDAHASDDDSAAPPVEFGGGRRDAKATVSLAVTLWLVAAIVGGIAAIFAWHPGASGTQNEAFANAGATSEVKAQLEAKVCLPFQYEWNKLPESVERVRGAFTGSARKAFDDLMETNRQIIEQARADSECRVDSIAVSSLTDDRAELLSILVITTSIGGEPVEQVAPRMQVTMVKDDGQWLISDVADV
ncbi:hypothetical protein MUG78_03310 [Gordonia alkaliphila]|uniref:hypothetical protein n=1 Tax=Gordonia alkaliphila TaxID=1053547 RepID=UPI001FF2D958|nr:hypothetical protein [Gordonia alkaliphila]MCK0438518.1 hypothetical protein [Gordonia alkaliphila]